MTVRIWKDRVQQTVTGTPGTGAFTLSTAVTNYQALAAGDDAKIGVFCATEGTAWETFIGTYTHSGTSLARTTRTDSSTGSAISFTSAAVVFLDVIATMSAQFDAPTNLITGTNAATTMVANATYVVDMSAWATADRNYTCPASPNVGDRVRIVVTAGNASFELIYKGNTSQTIDGGSAATERSRLMMTGECVELLYVASNTWITSYDGRIPIVVIAERTGVMSLVQNTATNPNWDTVTTDNSSCINSGGTHTIFNLRRAGTFKVATLLLTGAVGADATAYAIYSDIVSAPNSTPVYYGTSSKFATNENGGRLSGFKAVTITVPVNTEMSAEFSFSGPTSNIGGAEFTITEVL